MPITSSHDATLVTYHLRTWVIQHEENLAELIAKMALGRANHVAKILSQSDTPNPQYTDVAIAEAIEKLTVKSGSKPWHRDGLMFQYISWIAARIEHPASRAVLPHQITASKGLDGLLVNLADDMTVESIIICEDKASDKPQEIVRDQVWPEFVKFDEGQSDSVIVSAAESVLAEVAGLEPDAVTADLDWYGERRYRVSIGTSASKLPIDGFVGVFENYENKVSGVVRRRYACAMVLDKLRPELEALAQKSIAYLESWRPKRDV